MTELEQQILENRQEIESLSLQKQLLESRLREAIWRGNQLLAANANQQTQEVSYVAGVAQVRH